jgi:hypothetical protein
LREDGEDRDDAAGEADVADRALFGDVFEETCFGHGAGVCPPGLAWGWRAEPRTASKILA